MEEQKIVFVIADNDEAQRKKHNDYIGEVLEEYALPVPHEIHAFNDGVRALEFMFDITQAAGVILIADCHMEKLDGWSLLEQLSAHGLLPLNSFVCSSISADDFARFLASRQIGGNRDRIKFIGKEYGSFAFSQMLPLAIMAAAAEIGLALPQRRGLQLPVKDEASWPRQG